MSTRDDSTPPAAPSTDARVEATGAVDAGDGVDRPDDASDAAFDEEDWEVRSSAHQLSSLGSALRHLDDGADSALPPDFAARVSERVRRGELERERRSGARTLSLLAALQAVAVVAILVFAAWKMQQALDAESGALQPDPYAAPAPSAESDPAPSSPSTT